MTVSTDNILDIQGVSKHFTGFDLQNLTLSMQPGTITGLVGANGAGKSTTIKLILNLLRRDAGTIRIFGMDNIEDETAVKQRIGVVFDEPCFHDILNPRYISRYMAGLYPNWDQKVFQSYLKRFGLPETKNVKDYSRGMKMKLSIAAALSHNPDFLILDEPTSGLDPLVRDEILDIFLDFLQDERRAILLSSHITSDLDKVADTIALLDNGRLLFHEEKDSLRDSYVIVKGGAEQWDKLDSGKFIGWRKHRFGFDALCRRQDLRQFPNLPFERPTIEDIMLYFTKRHGDSTSAEDERI